MLQIRIALSGLGLIRRCLGRFGAGPVFRCLTESVAYRLAADSSPGPRNTHDRFRRPVQRPAALRQRSARACRRHAEARQFPQASGYPEDAATGIAATALFGALRHDGIDIPAAETVHVLQGCAMGRLSACA